MILVKNIVATIAREYKREGKKKYKYMEKCLKGRVKKNGIMFVSLVSTKKA